MQPVSPVIPGVDATEVIYAADQPQYRPLPALRCLDGTILTRWEFTEEEKQQVLEQGYIYLAVNTFNMPLQPVIIMVTAPDISKAEYVEMPEGTEGFSEFRNIN
jgi:hypothetical protein